MAGRRLGPGRRRGLEYPPRRDGARPPAGGVGGLRMEGTRFAHERVAASHELSFSDELGEKKFWRNTQKVDHRASFRFALIPHGCPAGATGEPSQAVAGPSGA